MHPTPVSVPRIKSFLFLPVAVYTILLLSHSQASMHLDPKCSSFVQKEEFFSYQVSSPSSMYGALIFNCLFYAVLHCSPLDHSPKACSIWNVWSPIPLIQSQFQMIHIGFEPQSTSKHFYLTVLSFSSVITSSTNRVCLYSAETISAFTVQTLL